MVIPLKKYEVQRNYCDKDIDTKNKDNIRIKSLGDNYV